MIREEIRKRVELAFQKLSPGNSLPDFVVEVPENLEHGDYSTNVAFAIARTLAKQTEERVSRFRSPGATDRIHTGDVLWLEKGAQPNDYAQRLSEYLKSETDLFKSVIVVPPGFINFSLSEDFLRRAVAEVLIKGASYGSGPNKKENILVEFVSANPTGPLTMANGRGGFYGDCLSNVLEKAGYDVTREYYINDVGNQIRLLGESIEAAEGKIPDKEEYYKGGYIKNLVGKSADEAAKILLDEIKTSLSNARIEFDSWFSENEELRTSGAIEDTLKFLEGKNLLETRDGAVWLGDRVLVKSNGEPTYLLSDLVYHRNKFVERKFDKAITIVGADHHAEISYVKESVTKFFTIQPERLHIIVMQLVRLVRGGKEVRMGKRTGEFVTLDELLEDVGVDAARYFFLERSPDTHMDFDLDLAKERSVKNPVYYVQYAHARMCSVFEKAGVGPFTEAKNLDALQSPHEFSLIKQMIQFEDVIEDISEDHHVHRLPRYAYELSRAFHNFYEKERIIGEDKDLMEARLTLVRVAQIVLQNTLNLMGISAPEKM